MAFQVFNHGSGSGRPGNSSSNKSDELRDAGGFKPKDSDSSHDALNKASSGTQNVPLGNVTPVSSCHGKP